MCIEDFRELNPSGRVLVMGDLNMDITQLESHRSEPGVSTLLRMQHYQTGPTARTQIRREQIERQIDHLFTDFPLQEVRKIKEAGELYGSDHACIAAFIPWSAQRAKTTIPSRNRRKYLISLIEKGNSIEEAIQKC